MRVAVFASAALALAALGGCSTYAVPRYSASAENVAALRASGDQKVSVGKFTAKESKGGEISCRAVGPIKTPDGETYEDYVRKALVSELIMANRYDTAAPVRITGELQRIDFDSMGGKWNLALLLQSTTGASVTASEEYTYTSSFYGETGCNQTAQAAMGAVQNLLNAAIRDPSFPALLTQQAVK